MAQFPFPDAILKLRVKKKSVPYRVRSFLFWALLVPPMPKSNSETGADLSALRRKITELVAKNAVAMVQNAIDAVNEQGQYQAIKYLFEMVGLYPAEGNDESEVQNSLAHTLLEHLGFPSTATNGSNDGKITSGNPLE